MTSKCDIPKIRIFIAAPYDANEERKCLESVISALNQPGGVLAQEEIELEVVEWSRFLESYTKSNQTIKVEELPLDEWDLFAGVLRFRFDGSVPTNTGNGNPNSPRLGNDTEEIFKCAYNAWKITGRPHLYLYRSHRSFSPANIDIDQKKHIQSFFDQFVNNYQNLPLYRVFNEIAELEKFLPNDIISHANNFKRYYMLEKQMKPTEATLPFINVSPNKSNQSDVNEIVFLRVDSLLHNPALKDQPIEKVGIILAHYREFIEGIIARYQGVQIYNGADGSTWAFWGDALHDRAVSAGIELISRQGDFNNNKNLNPFAWNLKPRMAAHCSAVDVSTPHGRPYLLFKNYITYLEKYGTPSGAFAVTDILYQELRNNLKKSLRYDRIHENDDTYSYSVSYEKAPVSSNEIGNLNIKIRDYIETLEENFEIAATSPNMAPDPSDMRRYGERIYKNYEYLYHRASDYDNEWPVSYFNKLIEYIKSFLKKEKGFYEKLEELPVKLRQKGEPNPMLLSIRDFIRSTRVYSISNLDLLLKQCEKVTINEINIDTILEEYMREKITAFVKADDFQEETTFAELFLNPRLKKKLKAFIETPNQDPLYEKWILRSWRLADFVRIEDRSTNPDQKIFPILSRDPKKGKYFKVVEQLLLRDSAPDRGQVKSLFYEQGIPRENIKEMDIDIVLKCLLIDHTAPGVRQYAFNNIQFKELWNIIAYSKTPIETIMEIAGQLSLINDEDRMKVFFDLILLRLVNNLFTPMVAHLLPQIKTMIEIFYKFDFFIETGYFRRLNDLSLRFKEKVGGNEIGILEDAMKKMQKEYEETGGTPSTQPKILKELPMAVQRKLARDGHYPEFFATSSNNDIADEVSRYINYNNIGKFVSISAINGTLFNKLLRRDELFKLPGVINAALCNPKCNVEFATRHASKLNRVDLTKFASNPNVNPDIRNYIRNRLK